MTASELIKELDKLVSHGKDFEVLLCESGEPCKIEFVENTDKDSSEDDIDGWIVIS